MTDLLQRYDWHRLEAAASSPVHIRDNESLREHAERWLAQPVLALDTEFMRTETFYPIPGLIQVADDQACYLIDPLEVSDMSPLGKVLAAPDVLKVVHAGSEDLELFRHSYGVLPEPLYDTQVGAAFAGWGFSMGLRRLVSHALDVELDKEETTSDWLQRPLTPEQERYAALDVAYLPTLALMQRQELAEKGRLAWAEEECAEVGRHMVELDQADPETYFQRFSQAWHFDDTRRAALRDLAAWRERTCRARDISRNRLLRNQVLLDIAERLPQNIQHLDKIVQRGRIVREYGQDILALVRQAPQSAQAQPPASIERPLHYVWSKRLKQMRATGRKAAEQHGLLPEVLLRKRDLDALIRSRDEQGQYHLPPSLSGWRKSLVGDALLQQIQQFEKS
ncbi:ribonuclease D [Marinobacterium sp. AK62]|uniref:Ribonuclease D n=1 Tax=Marinobacterium alkalitolerans TaxID=1542925 RepID=A0ABS3ZCX8_9GAMM|nr:ribonuclease D [Marinobacterium alkalitolerans]MBP0049552.1 ribonuclease D [Marinobacterium alkalitolerans]